MYYAAMVTNPLKCFRSRHGLTQSQLGLQLGLEAEVAQSRISHYESGRRDIPTDIAYSFIDLAAELGETFSLEDFYPRPLKAG